MKMIDVLNMMAKGEIMKGAKLQIVNDYNELYEYVYTIDEGKFCFLGEDGSSLCDEFRVDEGFLLEEVEFIPPKEKKYQLKLYEDDDFSYVTRSSYDSGFNYDISDKNEICEFITKFTQDEIDSEKLLKFVEKYGIKEEVDDNETN